MKKGRAKVEEIIKISCQYRDDWCLMTSQRMDAVHAVHVQRQWIIKTHSAEYQKEGRI